ncbi:MAG: hypothetical protein K0S30_1455 [Clostridia bacterium]|jgi:hypothetical protein|nr:hypothetical protein [Clostridia bacterium]
MSLSEKAKQIFREFLYEQSRSKGHNIPKDKNMMLSNLSEVFNEMDDYIEEKIKSYQTSRKNKYE